MKKINKVREIEEIKEVMSAITKCSIISGFLSRKLNKMTENYQSSFWQVDEKLNIKEVYQEKSLTEEEKKEIISETEKISIDYIIDLIKKDINIKTIFNNII